MGSAFESSALDKVSVPMAQTVHLSPADIAMNTELVDDLSLEEAFDLELPDEAISRLPLVADIVSYFSRRYFRNFQSPLPVVAIAA